MVVYKNLDAFYLYSTKKLYFLEKKMNQEKVIELATSGHNIFLTGGAGTGKTYTLNKIIKKLESEGLIVARTASTGIAGTHIDGTTIHSWSKIGRENTLSTEYMAKKILGNRYLADQMNDTDVLVIDEISMLSGNKLNMIDKICRRLREEYMPFGGLQVILAGDYFQLPPVKEEDDFSFLSKAWRYAELKVCYLDKVYRQEDNTLIEILNSIREGKFLRKHLRVLESLKDNNTHLEKSVSLYTTNRDVNYENRKELNKLEGELHTFKPTGFVAKHLEHNDNFLKAYYNFVKESVPVEEEVEIKIGAQVMTVINNPQEGYFNGTLCVVEDIRESEEDGVDKEIILKSLKSGHTFPILRHRWKMQSYNAQKKEFETVASFTQYPIKLAWNLTVHKSQGCTFDYVNMDLSNAFVENMGYVALSRAVSLDGLRLMGFNKMALSINPVVLANDAEFRRLSQENEGI
jgi:ATP-dependent exoDNAse (exonuclease V) alpha subunit